MKKLFATLLVAVMLLVSACSLFACTQDEQADSLVIYNWADYIYPEWEQDFKDYYKSVTGKSIALTYVTFDTPETLITKITKGDSNVDVMAPSEYAIQKLMVDDWLVPLNYFSDDYLDTTGFNGFVKYSDNVDQSIIEKIRDGFTGLTCVREDGTTYTASMIDYMVPYMYGTLGILYNRAAFNRLGITAEKMNKANWGILFNDSGNGDGSLLSEELTGSILMKDSIRDTYAATLFYLVESGRLDGLTTDDGRLYTELNASELINLVDDSIIEKCKEVLTEQKEQLFGYEVDFGKDDLLKGNAMVDLAWSGDAMYAVEESWTTHFDDDNDGLCDMCLEKMSELDLDDGEYELAYYVPHTYGNIWFDGWIVPRTYNPEHMTAIKLFINFLNTPSVAAANMYEIGYSAAVSPDVVANDVDARATLTRLYYVDAPEYYEFTDDELAENDGEYSYDSWDEFAVEFFEAVDDYDNSNWRYPFVSAAANAGGNRGIDTLGMMRDFGDKNAEVVTMWNYVRSAGVSAWGVVAWTAGVIALLAGAVVVVALISRRQKMTVIVAKAEK